MSLTKVCEPKPIATPKMPAPAINGAIWTPSPDRIVNTAIAPMNKANALRKIGRSVRNLPLRPIHPWYFRNVRQDPFDRQSAPWTIAKASRWNVAAASAVRHPDNCHLLSDLLAACDGARRCDRLSSAAVFLCPSCRMPSIGELYRRRQQCAKSVSQLSTPVAHSTAMASNARGFKTYLSFNMGIYKIKFTMNFAIRAFP